MKESSGSPSLGMTIGPLVLAAALAACPLTEVNPGVPTCGSDGDCFSDWTCLNGHCCPQGSLAACGAADGGDAGSTACQSDGDCLLGEICDLNAGICVLGCSASHGCPAVFEAQSGCDGGYCVIVSCATYFADCDGQFADGCEAYVEEDIENCGGCGATCDATNGWNYCANGSSTDQPSNCALACPPATVDCFPHSNGCVDTLAGVLSGTTLEYCGNCQYAMPTSGTTYASASCQSGQPVYQCLPGWADCSPQNGPCSTSTTFTGTDPTNCGGCMACSTVNNVPTCENNACVFHCDAGFANCGGPNAGCDVDFLDDAENCGACGDACGNYSESSGTFTCVNGVCQIQCPADYADCTDGGNAGCASYLPTDILNCGQCNHLCSRANAAAIACTGGVCRPTCLPGFADCSMPAFPAPDDGCETDLLTDPANCGGCDRPCGSSQSCVNGSCQ